MTHQVYPTQEELHKFFKYRDGKMYNKINRSRAIKGKEAGSFRDHGYREIRFNNIQYKTHRLIWIMFNGSIDPNLSIDHINGNPSDNRIENLRLVTHQENHFNKIKTKGYCWSKAANKWRAQITLNNKQIYLGLFDNKEDARAAYLKAKKEYHIITKKENV